MSYHIANSVKLILALHMLQAGITEGFGESAIKILKTAFPDSDITVSPAEVGRKLMAIARRETKNNEHDAQDALGNFFEYLTSAERWKNFAEDFGPDANGNDQGGWEAALRSLYSNARRRSMDYSMWRARQKEKGVDDAFGTKGEDGGAPTGGEGAMPNVDTSVFGVPVDDQAAIKNFIGLIDDHLPDLRASLSKNAQAFFDLVMQDDIGAFGGGDISSNMNQASALMKKHPEIYKTVDPKNWSGFVGKLRKQVVDEIWDYIDKHMSQSEYSALRDQFFGDVDPSYVRKEEKKKFMLKDDFQTGVDERKLSALKWMKENGTKLTPKKLREIEILKKKIGYMEKRKELEEKKNDSTTPAEELVALEDHLKKDLKLKNVDYGRKEMAEHAQHIKKLNEFTSDSEFGAKDAKEMERLEKKLKEMGIDTNAIPAMDEPKIEGWKLHRKTASFIQIASRICHDFT